MCIAFLAMSENYGRNSIPKNYDIYMLYVSLIYRAKLLGIPLSKYIFVASQKQVNCIRSQDGRLRILISQTRARGIKFVNADGTMVPHTQITTQIFADIQLYTSSFSGRNRNIFARRDSRQDQVRIRGSSWEHPCTYTTEPLTVNYVFRAARVCMCPATNGPCFRLDLHAVSTH